MCGWQQKVYKALLPLENQFRQELKKGKFLQMDETPLEVMRVNGQEARAEYWAEDRHRKKERKRKTGNPKKVLHVGSARRGRNASRPSL